jgi:hypothetical protein
LANKKKTMKEKHLAREQEKKKKRSKSKQKITPKNAKHTMGSPKRRNQKT